MSRRESRASMNGRQNDALFEFESFKKKFLLANKHITKLNSTLSVRIEELNAQISTLYVENLRLRASEISLTTQLKKEREKSRKIMADAEAATANLTKHLDFLRHSFNINRSSPPPSPPTQTRRPVLVPTTTLPMPRLSRPPDVPGIHEDEEECSSSNDHEPRQPEPSSPSRRKTKPKARLLASRLPLPYRVSSPPLPPTLSARSAPYADLEVSRSTISKRKPTRRQSGLLNTNVAGASGGDANDFSEVHFLPRIPSPAFGSPVRRDVQLDDDDDIAGLDPAAEADFQVGRQALNRNEEPELASRREKRKGKAKESEKERERDSGVEIPLPRERESKRVREDDEHVSMAEGAKSKLKDVTNSPRSRLDLPPLDTNATDPNTPPSTAPSSTRTLISAPEATAGPASQLPTPRSSSSPGPPVSSDLEAAPINGREKRARKSVNYAEPKLNTKMRKPDPPPGTTSTRKRTSVSTVARTSAPQSEGNVDDPAPRSSIECEPAPKAVNGRSSSPPSSTRSSMTVSSRLSSGSRPSAFTTIKRKKSRPHLLPDDDESDGVQADVDGEYSVGKGNGWVNVDGRRRSHLHSMKQTLLEGGNVKMPEDEGRRHSMAV